MKSASIEDKSDISLIVDGSFGKYFSYKLLIVLAMSLIVFKLAAVSSVSSGCDGSSCSMTDVRASRMSPIVLYSVSASMLFIFLNVEVSNSM